MEEARNATDAPAVGAIDNGSAHIKPSAAVD